MNIFNKYFLKQCQVKWQSDKFSKLTSVTWHSFNWSLVNNFSVVWSERGASIVQDNLDPQQFQTLSPLLPCPDPLPPRPFLFDSYSFSFSNVPSCPPGQFPYSNCNLVFSILILTWLIDNWSLSWHQGGFLFISAPHRTEPCASHTVIMLNEYWLNLNSKAPRDKIWFKEKEYCSCPYLLLQCLFVLSRSDFNWF